MVLVNYVSLCAIISGLLLTHLEAANWKQDFPKNSSKYRKDPESCGTCGGSYGFEYGKYSKCNSNNNFSEGKCLNSRSDVIEPDCGVTSFLCNSGQCIDVDVVCDGKPDCSDNSDESEKECSKLNCMNLFQCGYGACISKSAKCNGIRDCFDGSDEELCSGEVPINNKPTVTPPVIPLTPIGDGCIIPTSPPHGMFINSNNPFIALKPGDSLPQYSALITTCEKQYKTTPPYASYPVCLNGRWTSGPLGCARTCPSANSTLSTTITCVHGRTQLDNCYTPVEGTIANIKCDPLYEGQSGNPTRICRDGSWDYPIYDCFPVCGVKMPKGKPNIIGGAIAALGSYPWHVGIYANNAIKRHLCGGTILNRRVIVSAAHCFANFDGVLSAKENYLIAAGKYYRVYDDTRDQHHAQYTTIHSIHIPNRYKGAVANYEGDIAVVILMQPLRISIAVQPVCIDWTTDFEYQQLKENNVGVVVGWGYTKKGEAPSEELKELLVPYISYDQCYERVPIDFRRFLTYDKICAGFIYKGVAVCQGDSGGGLSFQRKYNDRFYLRGIVSTSPISDTSCDPDQFATYTLISRHIDFIQELETLYRV